MGKLTHFVNSLDKHIIARQLVGSDLARDSQLSMLHIHEALYSITWNSWLHTLGAFYTTFPHIHLPYLT